MSLTPNDITVLIHFHCKPEKHPRHGVDAVRDSIAMFLNNGAIEPIDDSSFTYRTTEKGRLWLKEICNTPAPTLKWFNAQGEVISDD